MGEDTDNFRLLRAEIDIKDVKTDVKEINKNVIIIQSDMRGILGTYQIIKYATITFFVANILMMVWTLMKNTK